MRPLARLAAVGTLFLLALSVGFGWRDIVRGGVPKLAELPGALLGSRGATEELAPTRVFREAMTNIDAFFFGSPDRRQLTYAAIQGMMASLGDPHTMLLEPDEARQFDERTRGQFLIGGIGAELSRDALGARVRRVFKGSPAEKSGMRSDDVIIKVNGREVPGRDLRDVVQDIRGQENTTVRLTVFREAAKETLNFNVVRKRVQIQDVFSEVLKGGFLEGKPRIGRLEVRTFSETIVSQFDEELKALESAGIQGLVIDLRGNPGGPLGAAVEMSARFLAGKLVVSIKRRNGRVERFSTVSGLARERRYPIVILVDETTASAAEIFAGAMRDYRVATLVGEHTYGKGSVQSVQALDGAQVKITIARYSLPSGEPIERKEGKGGEYLSGGLEPGVVVKRAPVAVVGDLKTDNQLRKAAELLLGKIR